MTSRPKTVRAIFLLTVFKILLAWVFFFVLSNVDIHLVSPSTVLYTAIAYMVLAAVTFVSIHRHQAWGVRLGIGLALIASFPAHAVIGMLIDSIAMGLSLTPSARAFFAVSKA